jgi:hypothetical protein
MSTFINVKSACGKSSAPADIFDLDLNQNGIICCDNCESILMCRNAWNYLYKK